MEFILKKELDLINGKNYIEFSFLVYIEEKMQGYENIDIDNITREVDNACTLNLEEIKKLDSIYPMYISLSIYYFLLMPKLNGITYECDYNNHKSIVKREDVRNKLNELDSYFYKLKNERLGKKL